MTSKTLGALAALLLFAAAPAFAGLTAVGDPIPGCVIQQFAYINIGPYNLIVLQVVPPPDGPTGVSFYDPDPAFGNPYLDPTQTFTTDGIDTNPSWHTIYPSPTLASAGGDGNVFWYMTVDNGKNPLSPFVVDAGVFDVMPDGTTVERDSDVISWADDTMSIYDAVNNHKDPGFYSDDVVTATGLNGGTPPAGLDIASVGDAGLNNPVPAPAALLLGLLGLSGLGLLKRRFA